MLELRNLIMHEFWYDYMKPKYGEKQNFVNWTQIVLSLILKSKIFMRIFQML